MRQSSRTRADFVHRLTFKRSRDGGDPLEKPATPSVFLDSRGKTIGTLTGNERRIYLPERDIAPVMKHAIIAIEDRRFYTNSGVDLRGIARAAVQDITAGEAVQGAFPLLFVFLFLSSSSLPRDLIEHDWFRIVATWNPVSYLFEGVRSLIIFGWQGKELMLAASDATRRTCSKRNPSRGRRLHFCFGGRSCTTWP